MCFLSLCLLMAYHINYHCFWHVQFRAVCERHWSAGIVSGLMRPVPCHLKLALDGCTSVYMTLVSLLIRKAYPVAFEGILSRCHDCMY